MPLPPPTPSTTYIGFTALAWAFAQPLAGLHRLALLEIARHADAAGRSWPSMARLAAALDCSPRWARKHVAELEAAGYIQRAYHPGKGTIFEVQSAQPEPFGPRNSSSGVNARPRNSSSGVPGTPVPGYSGTPVPPNRNNSNKTRDISLTEDGGISHSPNGAALRPSKTQSQSADKDRSGTPIAKPARYLNAKLYHIWARRWSRDDIGPECHSVNKPSLCKARLCGLISDALAAMPQSELEARLEAVASSHTSPPWVSLEAVLQELAQPAKPRAARRAARNPRPSQRRA